MAACSPSPPQGLCLGCSHCLKYVFLLFLLGFFYLIFRSQLNNHLLWEWAFPTPPVCASFVLVLPTALTPWSHLHVARICLSICQDSPLACELHGLLGVPQCCDQSPPQHLHLDACRHIRLNTLDSELPFSPPNGPSHLSK